MSDDLKDSFKNLSDALDMDADGAKDIEEKLEIIESAKNEVVEKVTEVTDDGVELEDKTYMVDTLKLMIESGKKVLQTLEKDIKIGTPPRQAEVYFNGLGKIADTVKNLMEINKTVKELKIKDKSAENSGTKNLTVNQYYTSNDLLDMVIKAEEDNNMKEIKAEFKIGDEV